VARANYEKNDHCENEGVCYKHFSSCSLSVSQDLDGYELIEPDHDEKRLRCFSSWSGIFTTVLRKRQRTGFGETMKRVMVVDNDAGVRKMLDVALRALNLNVSLAENAKEAFEIYRTQKVDFVLLDVQMPEMDGRQTLAKLKTIDPGVVCCLMSGSETIASDEISRLGAVGFLQKPFLLEFVRQMILARLGKDG